VAAGAAKIRLCIDIEQVRRRTPNKRRTQSSEQALVPLSKVAPRASNPHQHGMSRLVVELRADCFPTWREAQMRRAGERHIREKDQRLALNGPKRCQAGSETRGKAIRWRTRPHQRHAPYPSWNGGNEDDASRAGSTGIG
jgi:hypothetical protein